MINRIEKEINGKQVVLQRLQNNAVEKKLRFIERETSQLIDLNAKKLKELRVKNNHFKIEQIKKTTLLKDIKNEINPKWMSTTKYNQLINDKFSPDEFNEAIDKVITVNDEKRAKIRNKFIYFEEKRIENIQDKNQHTIYQIDYLISGKTKDGTEVRFPFALKEVREIKINKVNNEIKILLNDKIIPNKNLINWLGNKNNILIQEDMKDILELDKNNFIQGQLGIYKKLGFNFTEEDFENLKQKELSFKKENTSTKNDLLTAHHEAKHILASLYNDVVPIYGEINNTNTKLGAIEIDEYDSIDEDVLFEITIAPLSESEIKAILNYEEQFELDSDQDLARTYLQHYFNDDEEKKTNFLYKKYDEITAKILQNKNKLDLFTNFLFKQKSMNQEEIEEQFQSETPIESYYDEINEAKLERDNFEIEKVNILGYFKNLGTDNIFKDVEEIFSKTSFVDELLDLKNDEVDEELVFNEEDVKWGFGADYYQQVAAFTSIHKDKTIIQGPPGTGKTQTILNIINHNISHGKKTLIVSEKVTALDVIYRRINSSNKDLADFILNLYEANDGIDFYKNLPNSLTIDQLNHFDKFSDPIDIKKSHFTNLTSLVDEIKDV
ncbi:MAG: hypothetical protein GQ557_02100, partial [Mycoplasmataceae bacterium]|nr:hypothetical protein [Mycoplasmataceae bacterium]